MQFQPTKIPDVILIEPKYHSVVLVFLDTHNHQYTIVKLGINDLVAFKLIHLNLITRAPLWEY